MQHRADQIQCGALGEYQWIGANLRVGVPDPVWLDRLDDLLSLPSKRLEQPRHAPEIAVGEDGLIQCFASPVRFDSVNDLLIWLTLTCVDVLAEKNRLLLLHAASIIVNQEALLIFGPPYSGKSTLAGLALSRGIPLVGDDVVLVSGQSGRVQAVPRPLKTRTSEARVWQHRHSDPLRPGTDLYGGLHGKPCLLTPRSREGMVPLQREFAPGALHFLERRAGRGVSSHEATHFQALTSLLQYARDWSTPPLKAARQAAQHLLDLPQRTIQVGDNAQEAALDLILDGHA